MQEVHQTYKILHKSRNTKYQLHLQRVCVEQEMVLQKKL